MNPVASSSPKNWSIMDRLVRHEFFRNLMRLHRFWALLRALKMGDLTVSRGTYTGPLNAAAFLSAGKRFCIFMVIDPKA